MLDAAERKACSSPGGTIVEPTSGNTGTGLAMAAAIRGYRCILVMPDKMSKEKIDLLRAYGADVVITPTNVPADSPESYYGVANRLASEIPGRVSAQPISQSVQSRKRTITRPARRSGSRPRGTITHFVAGIGTGGTISGTARFLKEQESGDSRRRRRSRRLDLFGRYSALVCRRRHRHELSCPKPSIFASSTR